MGRSTPLVALGIVLVAVVLAGCGTRSEPTGELAPSYPVTVDGAGDAPTTLESEPKRIVALDAGSAELITAIGAGGRLVGAPAGVRVEGGKQPAVVIEDTGHVDIDKIVQLKPDLIVATPDTDSVDLAQTVRRTQAPVYLQPSRSIAAVEQAAIELGFLVGEPAKGRQLAGTLQKQKAEIEQRLGDAGIETVFVDRGFFITVPDQSLLGSLIRDARGKNIAREYEGLGPYPLARLRRANPDVYLATSDSGVTLRDLRRDPRTKDLKAVKSGRVVILPTNLVTRPGPNVTKGLEAVAVALHPDAFR